MKRFLKNAAIFASLAFCGLSILITANSASAAGTSAVFSFAGPTSLDPGESGTVSASVIQSGDQPIISGQGRWSNSDSACVAVTPVSGAQANSKVPFAAPSDSGFTGALPIATWSVQAVGENCSATITLSNGKAVDVQSDPVSGLSATTHTITVGESSTPVPSSDNQITGLTPSAGNASGSGASWTVSDVPRDADSITLTPSLPAGASVVGGSPVTCALSGDSSTCVFTVAAEDGSTKTYTVTVNKAPEEGGDDPEPEPTPTPAKKDSDATLKSLNASGYNLSPSFSPSVNSYTINVQNSVDGLNISAIPNSDKATVSIVGNTGWKVGVNYVTITVTAENGSKQTYTLNVIRAKGAEAEKAKEEEKKSSNNYLSKLVSHDGAISPEFNKETTSYNIKVPKDVTKLNLTALAEDEKAKVEIVGNGNFEIGKTSQVTVIVTAEDGTKRVYTLNVTRENATAETDLEDLRVGGYTIEPGFKKGIDKYSLTVPYDTTDLDVIATATNSGSRVEIIGNKGLAVGNNTILVKVTDKNGFTHVYELNVRRMEEPTFFGIRRSVWRIIFIVLGILLLFLLLLWLLFRRRRDREEYRETPVIDFKPAFNFGSRVGTDDDTVMPSGINNQAESIPATSLTQPQTSRFVDDGDDARMIEQTAQPVTATVTPAMVSSAASESSVLAAERRANKNEAERLQAEREKLEAEAIELRREKLRNEALEAEEVKKTSDDDLYDDEVTKDELYDALMDVKENHDSSKLKLLMKQEELNREKEKIKNSKSKSAEEVKDFLESEEAEEKASSFDKAQQEFWG